MQPIPGDHLKERPFWHVDHKTLLNASAADIWPWLVQMGNGRAFA